MRTDGVPPGNQPPREGGAEEAACCVSATLGADEASGAGALLLPGDNII